MLVGMSTMQSSADIINRKVRKLVRISFFIIVLSIDTILNEISYRTSYLRKLTNAAVKKQHRDEKSI